MLLLLTPGTLLYRSGKISGDRNAWFSDAASVALEFGKCQMWVVNTPIRLYKIGISIEGDLGVSEDSDNDEVIQAAKVKGYDGYVNDFEYEDGLDIGIFGPARFLNNPE